MSVRKEPFLQYIGENFVISAGSVLFRHSSSGILEICLLHHTKKNEWLLPKGRKDRGEAVEAAAVRETFEETGYACELWPQRMSTRAPAPGANSLDAVAVGDNLVEPIAITIRQLGEKDVKVIWWYITLAKEGIKGHGTQAEYETFDSIFVDASVAAERLTFQADRDIVAKALEIVTGGTGLLGS